MSIAISRDIFSTLQALQGTQRPDGLTASAASSLKAPPAFAPYFGQPADSMPQTGTAMQSDGQTVADTKVFRSTVSLAQVDPPLSAANPFAMRAALLSFDRVSRAYEYSGQNTRSMQTLGVSQLSVDNQAPQAVMKLFGY